MRTIKTSSLIKLFAIAAIFNCCHSKDTSENKNIYYDNDVYYNLIFNTALNYPYYHYRPRLRNLHTPELYDLKNYILHHHDTASDSSIGLRLAHHSWVYEDLSSSIISVSSGDSLLFAFPFYDEHAHRIISDSLYREEQLKHANLEIQLNHIRQEMGWNTTKDKTKVNRFITLFTDSLLHLREFTTKDTGSLKRELFKSREYASLMELYPEILKKHIGFLSTEAAKKDVRLFTLHDGYYGFWKFSVETDSSQQVFIHASIGPRIKNLGTYSIIQE